MNDRTKPSQKLTKLIGILGLISLILLTLGLVLYPAITTEHRSTSPQLTSKSQDYKPSLRLPTKDAQPPQSPLANSQPLSLALALRWKFDDIILEYQQHQMPLEPRLIQLAHTLELDSTDQAYLLALFGRYRDYQLALIEIKKLSPNIDEDMQMSQSLAFIEQAHDSQFQFFSEQEIQAFFAQDNAYDQQAIARAAIRQDTSLTPAQKQQLLAHQISQLGESEQQALVPSFQAEKIAALLDDRQTQPPEMTPEVSARVERVKIAQDEWRARIKGYQEFQLAIKEEYVDAEELEIKITAYLKQNFTSTEVKRLQVFLRNPSLYDAS
ncbi:lipase chaperone [Shewanella benthica]|uniref:lipase chaperone family protein n=1 Tax=Shewanella benthica TaxID=43661 RepID=UPI00187A4F4F|nr:lipase chaperone family protein [Shewanella benthica]MBE7214293.1 lipase chaperone family protein [Shewanella benthica]MCL1062951.1 lipase chaperone [Shewanella benthica]